MNSKLDGGGLYKRVEEKNIIGSDDDDEEVYPVSVLRTWEERWKAD